MTSLSQLLPPQNFLAAPQPQQQQLLQQQMQVLPSTTGTGNTHTAGSTQDSTNAVSSSPRMNAATLYPTTMAATTMMQQRPLHLYPNSMNGNTTDVTPTVSNVSQQPHTTQQPHPQLIQLQQLLFTPPQPPPPPLDTAKSQSGMTLTTVASLPQATTTNQQLQQAFQQALLGNNNDIVTGKGNNITIDINRTPASDGLVKGDGLTTTTTTPFDATSIDDFTENPRRTDDTNAKLEEDVQLHSV